MNSLKILEPRESTRDVQSLGRLMYEIRPSYANAIAGFIIAAIMAVGGVVLIVIVTRDCFLPGGRVAAFSKDWYGGFMAILLGLFLIYMSRSFVDYGLLIWGVHVRVCSEGFWYSHRGSSWVYAWDDIVAVEVTVTKEQLPVTSISILNPTAKSSLYGVIRCDGVGFVFDENIVPRPAMLAGPLIAAMKKRGVKIRYSGDV